MARGGILIQQGRSLRLGPLRWLRRATYSTINHNGLLSEQKRDTNGGAAAADDDDDNNGTRSQPRLKHTVCLPTVYIPKSLETAQEILLSDYPDKQLAIDGAALMKYLRTRRPPSVQDQKMKQKGQIKTESANLWKDHTSNKPETIQTPLRYGKREGLACVAMRPQAGYGVCLRVFSEVARLQPKFNPQVMLDFGSGLGTALWAAQQVWGESLYEYQAIDSSQDMGELARALRVGGRLANGMLLPSPTEKEAISGVHFKQYLPVSNKVKYDLVVAANTLSELSTVGIRKSTIAALWRKTKSILVLIELGTRTGYNVINEARDFILNASNWTKSNDVEASQLVGHILAPCPHDNPCPLSVTKYYCSFAQRVQLSPAQRHTGLRHRGCYIEPFSYLVMKKGPRPTEETDPQSRLILPAMKRTRHVRCKLCCPNGKEKLVILTKTKTDKELYRRARKSNWGDTLPVPRDTYDDDDDTTQK